MVMVDMLHVDGRHPGKELQAVLHLGFTRMEWLETAPWRLVGMLCIQRKSDQA
jgi:hypothetical protein